MDRVATHYHFFWLHHYTNSQILLAATKQNHKLYIHISPAFFSISIEAHEFHCQLCSLVSPFAREQPAAQQLYNFLSLSR